MMVCYSFPMPRPIRLPLVLACFALLFASAVRAELTVPITRGSAGAMPIAIAPFTEDGLPGANLAAIITADLAGSGRFATLAEAQMPERPAPSGPVNFPLWQSAGQEYLVTGRTTAVAGTAPLEAEFTLFDAIRGASLLTERLPFTSAEARHTAHRIADLIYKQLTGERGAFNTRIAYVTAAGAGRQQEYTLRIADADGQDARVVMSSPEPLMSPAWSPDGQRMAYVSFEGRTAAVYVQNLATGERRKVSAAPGINGAPAWSPDGATLALTLSKEGSPDIYALDIAAGTLRRLTRDASIETEAHWSPDGRSLVFTSDRGGKPQLYLLPVSGGEPQRLTYDGEYNAHGVFAPDGRRLALVHGGDGGYRIAVLELAARSLRILTQGRLDESPSFAPNGRTILYIRKDGGSESLATVSLDGQLHRRLPVKAGAVRSAAWSP